MTYTGEVEVGGAADTREIDGITLTKVAVGPMNNNAYLLRDGASGQALLIDAAAEAGTLLALVGGTPLAKIVTTHQHHDHWGALGEVKDATGAVTVAHPLDAPGIPVATGELVDDEGVIRVGGIELTAIHLVGHTPGSIALLLTASDRPHLFTGDCLFPGGVGNTQKDPGRFASLLSGVEEKVFGRLPDQTWVYPGHGTDTTLGAERPHLAGWRERGW
ncbi:MAG TPA: MBL fold metallo-hydrolase [Trebonia sp.]|nr:MBL fold metallo-hydrolase [Trebonia sp.]